MDPQHVHLVKEWVRLDNIILRNNINVQSAKEEVKKLEDLVSDVVEKKKEVEKQITEYIKTNKLESMQLKISDGIITFGKKTTQKPISHKFLREVLQKYADENPDDDFNHIKVFEFIIANIDKKIDYSINRNIKANTEVDV